MKIQFHGIVSRSKYRLRLAHYIPLLICLQLWAVAAIDTAIPRRRVVSQHNPIRTSKTEYESPLQVGNGNIAFSADITGLQTFRPFSIMSSWGWKNDTLPAGVTQESLANYVGQSWWNHNQTLLVPYTFGGVGAEENWLRSNPNRANLARIGLAGVQEGDLSNSRQELDLWSGILESEFSLNGTAIKVETACGQETDAVGITITSAINISLFIDFPWLSGVNKFEAPYVGSFDSSTFALHSTELINVADKEVTVKHTLVNNTFYTTISSSEAFRITRDGTGHKYTLTPSSTSFSISVGFSLDAKYPPIPNDLAASSRDAWAKYWTDGAFVDLTLSSDNRAKELQRRIILSRYLMRINAGGDTPPQESGLVNNGWFGKFHLEMIFWHTAHWALWGNISILERVTNIYHTFLHTAKERAIRQGWGPNSGARWGKMSDPTGRSAPGEINELLIWQQPHPILFAQYFLRAAQNEKDRAVVLKKWRDVVWESAEWMSTFAWQTVEASSTSNETFGLVAPLYVVSEDTKPNVTNNPAFELAYWRWGLDSASSWMVQLGEEVPSRWTTIQENLSPAPLSQDKSFYKVYEGIEENFWDDPAYTNDHPALAGLHGMLPLTSGLDLDITRNTIERVGQKWNISNCWGWDFPLLALASVRSEHNASKAIDWLLHPLFQFDDAGMPIGGVRVPTPYFPGSGGLLYAVGMMAGGWDGVSATQTAPGFPSESEGWIVRVQGMNKAI